MKKNGRCDRFTTPFLTNWTKLWCGINFHNIWTILDFYFIDRYDQYVFLKEEWRERVKIGDKLNSLFESTIKKYQQVLEKNRPIYKVVGYVKLLLFVLFLFAFHAAVTQGGTLLDKVLVVVLFAAQIAAWIYHHCLDQSIDHAEGLIKINHRHLDRRSDGWTAFSDFGEEFIDQNHPYGCDLDIVGRKSLFQFLNRTHTWHGRQLFAKDLLAASYTKQQIEQRQEAIKELAENHAFADEMEYFCAQIGPDPAAETLVQELQDTQTFFRHGFLRVLLIFGPIAAISLTAMGFALHENTFYIVATVLFAIQSVLWLVGLPAIYRYLQGLEKLPFRLKAYGKSLQLIEKTTFRSAELQEIKARLVTSDISATKAIKELTKIADKVSVRSNPIIYFLCNVILLWDYECVGMVEQWKHKYAAHCEQWFNALGQLESLLSLAAMINAGGQICFPDIAVRRGAEAKQLGHPLIRQDCRVTNQLDLVNDIFIISGSNMSGKTTYLRTVGINIVLARAGGPVCAEEMSCSDLHVVTSMRIADDLNEGISTFYAELKRVKHILDTAKEDRSALFLIDEIFRGTNSVDRLEGASAVITKLSKLDALGMITTHDLELCTLEENVKRIKNYSFSEHYEEGRICFDYKMQLGKSRTTNAKFLMELLGIV